MHPKTAPLRRERPKTATRDRILAGIYSCFRRFGIQKTTIEDIATAAGVTRRTIYKHFPSKADIVTEIAVLETTKTTQEILQAMHSSKKAGDMLTECLYLATVVAHREPFRRELSGLISVSALANDPASKIHQIQRDTWQPLLGPVLDRGLLADDLDLDLVVSWLSLNLYGLLTELELHSISDAALKRFIRRFPITPLLPSHELNAAGRSLPSPKLARTKTKTSDDADNTIAAILRAARQCFTDQGFKNTSLANIADHAGISSRTIYRHFNDRETLIEQITLLEIDDLIDSIRQRVQAVQPIETALTEAVVLLLRQAEKNVFLRELLESTRPSSLPAENEPEHRSLLQSSLLKILDGLNAAPAMAKDLRQEESANWLQFAIYVLHTKVGMKTLSDSRLRHFVRRFVVAPLLA